MPGQTIEEDSFSIIDQEVGEHAFTPDQWVIIRRVIHATADFEFKEIMSLHPGAVDAGLAALMRGCPVIADVKMIVAGLNWDRLRGYGCQARCFISDSDVMEAAKMDNVTRAAASIKKAKRLNLLDGAVVAVGNAPTALMELTRTIRHDNIKPALIVGVPVGFVSAEESKEEVLSLNIPYIISRGRKGGSAAAVAIIHALLVILGKRLGGDLR